MDSYINYYEGSDNNYQNNGSGGQRPGQGGRGGNGNNGSNNAPRKQSLLFLLIACLVTLLFMSYFMKAVNGATTQEISYDKFVEMVDEGKVESVFINSDKIEITPKTEANTDAKPSSTDPMSLFRTTTPAITYYTGISESNDALTERLLKAGVEINNEIPDNSGWLLSILLTYVLPILLLWGVMSLAYRRMSKSGGGIMGV